MIGPPEKGASRSDPSLSTGLNPADLARMSRWATCQGVGYSVHHRLFMPRYQQRSFKTGVEILDSY